MSEKPTPDPRCGTRADWDGLNPYEHMLVATRVVTPEGAQPYCLMKLEQPAWLSEAMTDYLPEDLGLS